MCYQVRSLGGFASLAGTLIQLRLSIQKVFVQLMVYERALSYTLDGGNIDAECAPTPHVWDQSKIDHSDVDDDDALDPDSAADGTTGNYDTMPPALAAYYKSSETSGLTIVEAMREEQLKREQAEKDEQIRREQRRDPKPIVVLSSHHPSSSQQFLSW